MAGNRIQKIRKAKNSAKIMTETSSESESSIPTLTQQPKTLKRGSTRGNRKKKEKTDAQANGKPFTKRKKRVEYNAEIAMIAASSEPIALQALANEALANAAPFEYEAMRLPLPNVDAAVQKYRDGKQTQSATGYAAMLKLPLVNMRKKTLAPFLHPTSPDMGTSTDSNCKYSPMELLIFKRIYPLSGLSGNQDSWTKWEALGEMKKLAGPCGIDPARVEKYQLQDIDDLKAYILDREALAILMEPDVQVAVPFPLWGKDGNPNRLHI